MAIPINKTDEDLEVRNITAGGDVTVRGAATVEHGLKVKGWLDAPNVIGAGKGMFRTSQELRVAYPRPENGLWAIVGTTLPGELWLAYGHQWQKVGTGGNVTIQMDQVLIEELVRRSFLPYGKAVPNTYSGEQYQNMNDNLETGFYPYCILGRPAGSTGYFTLLTVRSYTADYNGYATVWQMATGRNGNVKDRTFIRLIFVKDTEKEYGEWAELTCGFDAAKYAPLDADGKVPLENLPTLTAGNAATIDYNDLDKFGTDGTQEALAQWYIQWYTSGATGYWIVKFNGGPSVGTLSMFMDQTSCVIWQVLTTATRIADGKLTGSHVDGELHTYRRCLNINSRSGNLGVEKWEWTPWKEMYALLDNDGRISSDVLPEDQKIVRIDHIFETFDAAKADGEPKDGEIDFISGEGGLFYQYRRGTDDETPGKWEYWWGATEGSLVLVKGEKRLYLCEFTGNENATALTPIGG